MPREFITPLIILALASAGMYLFKAKFRNDITYIASAIARFYMAVSLALFYTIGYKDLLYIHLGIVLILFTDLVHLIIYYTGKNLRRTIENKKLSLMLNELNSKYQTVVENALVGFYTIDERGRFEFVNKRFCEITRYSREELLRMTAFDLIHPCDKDLLSENIKRRISGLEQNICYEARIITKDEQTIRIKILGSATSNGHKTITGTILPL